MLGLPGYVGQPNRYNAWSVCQASCQKVCTTGRAEVEGEAFDDEHTVWAR